MPSFHAEAELPIDAFDLWVLKDLPEYTQFTSHRGGQSYEVLSTTVSDCGQFDVLHTRSVPYERPNRAVRKLIQRDEMVYENKYTVPRRAPPFFYAFNSIPPVFANKITIKGVITIHPLPDGRCRQSIEGTAEVKILGVGKMVCSAIVDGLKKTYQELPATFAAFAEQFPDWRDRVASLRDSRVASGSMVLVGAGTHPPRRSVEEAMIDAGGGEEAARVAADGLEAGGDLAPDAAAGPLDEEKGRETSSSAHARGSAAAGTDRRNGSDAGNEDALDDEKARRREKRRRRRSERAASLAGAEDPEENVGAGPGLATGTSDKADDGEGDGDGGEENDAGAVDGSSAAVAEEGDGEGMAETHPDDQQPQLDEAPTVEEAQNDQAQEARDGSDRDPATDHDDANPENEPSDHQVTSTADDQLNPSNDDDKGLADATDPPTIEPGQTATKTDDPENVESDPHEAESGDTLISPLPQVPPVPLTPTGADIARLVAMVLDAREAIEDLRAENGLLQAALNEAEVERNAFKSACEAKSTSAAATGRGYRWGAVVGLSKGPSAPSTMASAGTHSAPSSTEQARRELQAMRHLVSSLSADNVAASAKAVSARKTADDLGRELAVAQSAAITHAETVQKLAAELEQVKAERDTAILERDEALAKQSNNKDAADLARVREDRDELLSRVNRLSQRSRDKSDRIDKLSQRVKDLEREASSPKTGNETALRRLLDETTLKLQERSVEVDLLSIRLQRLRGESPAPSPAVSALSSSTMGGSTHSPDPSPMMRTYDRPSSAPPAALDGSGRRKGKERKETKDEKRRRKEKEKRPGCTG